MKFFPRRSQPDAPTATEVAPSEGLADNLAAGVTRLQLTVPEMRCENCVNLLTKVTTAVDLNAKVTADLATKQLNIETSLAPEVLRHAITAAGYESILV